VRDLDASSLAGFDAVVHLAALSNDPLGDLNPAWTQAVNLDASVALARAAREAGVARFVLASSCSMYGRSEDEAPLTEDAPLRPLTPYAESKVRAEEAIALLADAGFAPVFMRNGTAYGVSPRLRLDVVLDNLTAWAHTTGRVRLLSDGQAWRPLVHVEDIARTTLALLEAPADRVRGEAFNVGTAEQNYRIRELAETVGARSGCEVEVGAGATADPRSYRVDFTKLERTLPDLWLGWTAELGVDELLAAYRRQHLALADLEGSRFLRVNRIRELLEHGRLDENLRWRDTGDGERAA
jgi:nucleoside-diphosphate-sugar epimerase